MTGIPKTIREAARLLRRGDLTSVELTRAVLARADRLDETLGIFITRMDETAYAQAARADAAFAHGVDRGPLQGIPIGLKDILSTDDAPTTAQSLAIDPTWGRQGQGAVVSRLVAAGAVIAGKNTTHEFASGGPDQEKPFPIPKNPWKMTHQTGGSSSGTGAGVAAGFFLGGVGTDTSGSVRWPAAYCGVSGLMGTFGRVPKSGCTQNGFSLDHVGPLARSAWDCAAMLEVMAGRDPADIMSSDRPVDRYTDALTGDIAGMRIAVIRDGHVNDADCSADVRDRFEAAVRTITELGADVQEISIPRLDVLRNAAWVNNAAEKSAIYLTRFRESWSKWGRFTRVGMSSFGLFLSPADYVAALRVRTYAARILDEAASGFDAILTPTAKTPATPIDGIGYSRNLNLPLYTSLWSWLGWPAIAIPMGFAEGELPVSLQVSAKPWQESTILRIADAYQRHTNWHLCLPPVVADAHEIPPVRGSVAAGAGGKS